MPHPPFQFLPVFFVVSPSVFSRDVAALSHESRHNSVEDVAQEAQREPARTPGLQRARRTATKFVFLRFGVIAEFAGRV